MMRHLALVPLTALLTAAAPAFAGGDGSVEHARTYSADLERPLVLVSAAEMLRTEVDNGGQMFGEICDLVVDRDTGRTLFAVVGGNGVIGLTDLQVAVPYEELTWRSDDGKFSCDLSPERLRKMEVFCVERLQQLGCSAAEGPAGAQPVRSADPHAMFFAGCQPVPADGSIVAVLGWNHDDSPGAQVAIAVRMREGDEQRFLLGPPEFLAKGLGAPLAAGQRIALEAVRGSDDVGTLWVAKTARVEDATLELRDAQGQPLWKELRHALVSDLAKCVVVAQGGAAGEIGPVQDVVLDARTGQVVFVTVWVAEDLRAIPMRALSIAGEDKLELSKVSKDAFLGCPRLLGEEIAELNDPTLRAGIYSFFGVDPGRVLPR